MAGLSSKEQQVKIVGATGTAAHVDSAGNLLVATSGGGAVTIDSDGVTWTTFELVSDTSWNTLVSTGSGEMVEFRIFGISNGSDTITDVAFRFGTNDPFFDQPIPAGGGGYNQNCIGGYIVGGDAEDLEVSCGTSVDYVKGHVVTRLIT